jgi:hypothetical protein
VRIEFIKVGICEPLKKCTYIRTFHPPQLSVISLASGIRALKMGCKNAESKTVRKVQNEGTTSSTFKEKCSPYRRRDQGDD